MDRGQMSRDEGLNGDTGQTNVSSSGMADTAGRAMDQVRRKTDEVVQQQVAPRIEGQKGQVAEQVHTLAKAIRESGSTLRESDAAYFADWVDRGAGQIERFAGYLRHSDVNDMIRDVERFARQQPVAFVAGAFAIGLLAARFLKSSPSSSGDESMGYGYSGRRPSGGWASSGTQRQTGAYSPTATGISTPSQPRPMTTSGPVVGTERETERTRTTGPSSSTAAPSTLPGTPRTQSPSTGQRPSNTPQPGQMPRQGMSDEERRRGSSPGSPEVH